MTTYTEAMSIFAALRPGDKVKLTVDGIQTDWVFVGLDHADNGTVVELHRGDAVRRNTPVDLIDNYGFTLVWADALS
jgi:hypothetical protein